MRKNDFLTKFLPLVILSFVLGCVDNQPSGETPISISSTPQTTDNKADVVIGVMSCGGSQWVGDEIKLYQCQPEDDQWRCVCDGVAFISSESECRDALQSACNVGDEVFGGCNSQFGECHRDGDEIKCQCDETGNQFTTTQEACTGDLFTMCSSSCENGPNSCVPNAGVSDTYRCQCGQERTKTIRSLSCDQALDTACNRVACSGWAGYCQEVTSPEWSYDCQCVNGDTGSRTITELGGANCDAALLNVCGEPESDSCAYETTQGEWSCEQKDGTADEYECTCRVQCQLDQRMIVDTFQGDSCDDVLYSFCNADTLCAR